MTSSSRFKNNEHVVEAFKVDPIYLKHSNQGKIVDYRVGTTNERLDSFTPELASIQLRHVVMDDVIHNIFLIF